MTQRSGNTRAGKGPALSGKLMVDTVRGKLRIRSWPKPRGKQNQNVQAAYNMFTMQQWAWKYQPPQITSMWIEATQGTPYYPRDIWTSLQYGRAIWWIRPEDRRKFFTMAFREDVSNSLDAISQDQGTILVRGPDLWEVIQPGQTGQVLTSGGSQVAPAWANPGTQSQPLGPAAGYGGFTTDEGDNCTKMQLIVPTTNFDANGLTSYINAFSVNDEYRAVIAEVSEVSGSATITAIINEGPLINPVVAGPQAINLPFSQTVTLAANTPTIFGLQRVDGSGTSRARTGRYSASVIPGPINNTSWRYVYASTQLAVDDTPDGASQTLDYVHGLY